MISNTGWIVDAVTILPVATISAKSIGRSEFRKPTRLFTVFFIKSIISEKFVMTRVTISIYWT